MNTDHLHHALTATQYAALVDSAKADAAQLRRAAIDAFWAELAMRIRGISAVIVQRRPPQRSTASRGPADAC